MEVPRAQGIPIVTYEVVNAALLRNAYLQKELTWINNRLSAIEPNLSDYIQRNIFDIVSRDVPFAFIHTVTGGIGTRRERRFAQNIVLHTIALLADQEGYYKTGRLGDLDLYSLLPIYSMREDIFSTLRRETKQQQTYLTGRILETERLTWLKNPLLHEEIEEASGYGTRWQRWVEGIEPVVRPSQAGYITTYGVLTAIHMQNKTMR